MRALRFHKTGSLDDLPVEEVSMPRPAAGEVLVQVRAAAINPSDRDIAESRTDQRVRDHAPHAMSNHDDPLTRGIVVARINRMNREQDCREVLPH